MLMRASQYLAIACITLISCSKSKQDESTSSKQKAASKEDAVVILQQSEPDTLKGSLNARAVADIDATHFLIEYHSPAVRGRIVWGGLVPYDKVWVTGAHRATSIEFDKPIVADGKEIPSGKYALFTIPGKEFWTIIINSNWNQHLTDQYDEKLDILRLKVVPEIEQTHQERLRYVIEGSRVNLYWDQLKISIPFKTTG